MDETRFQLIRIGAFILSFGLMFAVQSLAPYRRALRPMTGSWRQNIPLAVINSILMSLVCGACLCTAARSVEARGVGLFHIIEAPAWLAVAGTVLVLDFTLWAWHLANHRFPWLWRFHRVHHSDRDFDISTSLRFHAGELLQGLPLKLAVVAGLGAPLLGILLFEVGFGLFNLFVHGNIRLPVLWERHLTAILILPASHRLHHSVSPREHNRNFGTILSLWDRGFGTWAGGSSADTVTTGLPEMMLRRSLALWECLTLPFARRMLPGRAVARGLLGLALAGVGFTPAWSAEITLEPVLKDLESPVYVTHAGDGSGRLFILEQAGIIKVLRRGSTAPSVFLDIRSRVSSGGERGLLGLAFHPEFETNRRFFVNYTRRPGGATVVAEYHASKPDPNLAATGESVILTVAQPYSNHNGGMIEFGPDGYLYIAMGDGGSGNDPGNRAQNVDELLGKILRIDIDKPASATVRYSSPADNPFASPKPGRDEIFAYGLRNPWRFSFDRQTGALLAGDVGQDAREEIDKVVVGGNYGWRVFEGNLCTRRGPGACDAARFVPPIAEYSHTKGRCSVTGGYVYRGRRGSLPQGAYLFGDYCSGELFLLEGDEFTVVGKASSISSFGEDQDGELYVVEHGGTVHRVRSARPPGTS